MAESGGRLAVHALREGLVPFAAGLEERSTCCLDVLLVVAGTRLAILHLLRGTLARHCVDGPQAFRETLASVDFVTGLLNLAALGL